MGFYPEYSDENLVGINMLSNMFIYIYITYTIIQATIWVLSSQKKQPQWKQKSFGLMNHIYIYMLQLLKLPNQDNLLHHNTSFCLWHCSPTQHANPKRITHAHKCTRTKNQTTMRNSNCHPCRFYVKHYSNTNIHVCLNSLCLGAKFPP